jgi:cytidyltransferase-like protein
MTKEFMRKKAIVSGGLDDIKSSDVRFLEEASKYGDLHICLWSDKLVREFNGKFPKFPQAERLYFLQAIRYVTQIYLIDQLTDQDSIPILQEHGEVTWVINDTDINNQKRVFCASQGIKCQVVKKTSLRKFSKKPDAFIDNHSQHKKVVVTGCFDWFHSGHVRFFEEVSGLGDLYVVVGSDQNVELLKGKDHPMYPQDERRYMVQSIRFVKQALLSTGNGWMDAEPEIKRIKPDIYAVNEDGDVPEKRSFCELYGIQYVVLKRTPKEGLPKRISTDLRGF